MRDAQADIDALIAAFYAAFDNRAGRRPTLEQVTTLFVAQASITVWRDGATDTWSPDAFAAPRIALLTGGGLVDFHEWETRSSTQVVDGIAARSSRYAKRGVLDGAEYAGQGTKFFHLARTAAGWRIAALAWVDDPAP